MKKTALIHIINPEQFIEGYFDQEGLRQPRGRLNIFAPRTAQCYFAINPLEAGIKYINFPKDSIKKTFYELFFLTNSSCRVTENLTEIYQEAGQIRFSPPGTIVLINEVDPAISGFHVLFDEEFITVYAGVTNLLHTCRAMLFP